MNKLIFTIFLMVIFQNAALSQANSTESLNTNCSNALNLCSNEVTVVSEFQYQYSWNFIGENCSPSIAPMYFSFDFSQAGNMSVILQGNADFVLYGPMQGNALQVCDLVNSYSTEFVTGTLNAQQSSYNFNYAEGVYVLQLMVDNCQGGINFSGEWLGANLDCETTFNCVDCITSFQPTPGRYIVSAWVKEANAPVSTTQYSKASIGISFTNSSLSYTLEPKGSIIDGWQRIEGEVYVPFSASTMDLTLQVSQGEAFFDDIRFFPFDGSMMSYVYDPESLRLMAELDERNYATFYEYDEEGKLIRVKKETEKGVMTIQENRDNIRK